MLAIFYLNAHVFRMQDRQHQEHGSHSEWQAVGHVSSIRLRDTEG
jgi:hypothetical protein